MARLPYLDKSDLLPEHQDLLARNLNLYRVLAHSPRAARSLNTLARFIRDGSRLDPRLRELAILQVSYLTRSAWGFSHHVRIGREVGVSAEEIRAVADETDGRPTALDPLAKAVLRAAREMTLELTVSNETFAALRQGLDGFVLNDGDGVVVEAEIALASRDLAWPTKALAAASATLEAHGDRANAAHARYLEARRLLLGLT